MHLVRHWVQAAERRIMSRPREMVSRSHQSTDWMSKLWHFPSLWDKISPAERADWAAHVVFLVSLTAGLAFSGLTYISCCLCVCVCKHQSGFGFRQTVEHLSVYVRIRALNLTNPNPKHVEGVCLCNCSFNGLILYSILVVFVCMCSMYVRVRN